MSDARCSLCAEEGTAWQVADLDGELMLSVVNGREYSTQLEVYLRAAWQMSTRPIPIISMVCNHFQSSLSSF